MWTFGAGYINTVSLLARPKSSQWEAEPGRTSCTDLALSAREAWWEVDDCEVCQRSRENHIPGRGAERGSLSSLTAPCCCLNLKMNRCWVAMGGFGANLDKYRGTPTDAKVHAHTGGCIHAPQSIHYFYGIFLGEFYPGYYFLCLNFIWFHFKTHKATGGANACSPVVYLSCIHTVEATATRFV